MDRRLGSIAVLGGFLAAGLSFTSPLAAAPSASADTTRSYAACVVTDASAKRVYATAPGRIDVVGEPALDAQAYAGWVARQYNVPAQRLGNASCVIDPRSLDAAEMRLKPLIQAGDRQGFAVQRTRWWLSQ
jgi:hypothetical protein